MADLSIQLLQFLAIFVPVMFASIRLVYDQDGKPNVEDAVGPIKYSHDENSVMEMHIPYSSFLLLLTFIPFLLALLILVANVGFYVYSGSTSSIAVLIIVLLKMIGILGLSGFIIWATPRIELPVFE